jgi:hypothetical protein
VTAFRHSVQQKYEAMTNNQEEITRFLSSIPDTFQIHEEAIKPEIQKAYFDYSDGFDNSTVTDNQLEKIAQILFHPETTDEGKKKALTILAHTGSVKGYKFISKFYENAFGDIKQWTSLALRECRMFLETELTDKSTGFISSGLGGEKDKLRIYFLILPLDTQLFSEQQHRIIENEFSETAKDLDCVIENFDFQENYVGLIVLIPMTIAIATFIDTGIQNSNEFGGFVLEHYYAGNTGIPDRNEIDRIIEIVRNG